MTKHDFTGTDTAYRTLMAKSDLEDASGWLPLWMHLRDTAGVMKKLVHSWVPESVIRACALEYQEFEKTAVFVAAVHDIGKATSYFQHIISLQNPIRRQLLDPTFTVNNGYRFAGKTPHSYAGQWILQSSETGFHVNKSVACVIGAHHGKPMASPELNTEPDLLKAYEVNFFGEERSEAAQAVWKAAWDKILVDALDLAHFHSADELPRLNAQAQVLLSGLLIVSDWIASNTTYFPLISSDEAGKEELYPRRVNRGFERVSFPDGWNSEVIRFDDELLRERFGFFPNAVQTELIRTVQSADQAGLYILEAQMGVGKTEAALGAAEILASKSGAGGVFFGLPTQATSNGMFPRLYAWAQAVSEETGNAIRLAHGAASLNPDYEKLMDAGTACVDEIEDQENGLSVHSWFQGNKRALLADFVIGTVDQFLMASLRRKHFMLRHLGLAGKVVILDECHAYDAYMNQYLDRTLEWMAAYGVPVILLSATLPAKRRQELVTCYANAYSRYYLGRKKSLARSAVSGWEENLGYPLLTWTDGEEIHQTAIPQTAREKEIGLHVLGSSGEMIDLLQAKLSGGGCACIILNTVRAAQEVYETVRVQIPDAQVLLCHAQYTMPDRSVKEQTILKHLGKTSGAGERYRFILIGTQVLEQSLDYDADIMITQLCPMDLLLQRLGRLHRHERVRPQRLRNPEIFLLSADSIPQDEIDALKYDDGSRSVYGDYLLMRTIETLKGRTVIRTPSEIPRLVQEVYREDCRPSDPETAAAWETYQEQRKSQKQRAEGYRLSAPCRAPRTIESILRNADETQEKNAECNVRDADQSIEVLLLKKTPEGRITACGSGEGEFTLRADEVPDPRDAKCAARQRLRLPRVFSRKWNLHQTIRELEDRNIRELAAWQKSPWIKGELVLLLDENAQGTLSAYRISYDSTEGFLYRKEEADAGEGI